ncbi:MAG: hypothetical protein LUE10_00700 [Alistipes sp.]|nr:hypothetical protein [Alistipes sp.]
MLSIRILKDRTAGGVMFFLTIATLLLVFILAGGLFLKSAPIFEEHTLGELLFSSNWKPLRNEFGFLPFIMGTLWVTGLAILIALPIALLTAVYLTEYARPRVKKLIFPALDILAGLPSVIYGVWGTLLIVPLICDRIAPPGSWSFRPGIPFLPAV